MKRKGLLCHSCPFDGCGWQERHSSGDGSQGRSTGVERAQERGLVLTINNGHHTLPLIYRPSNPSKCRSWH